MIVPKSAKVAKDRAKVLIAAGLLRAVHNHGKDALVAESGGCGKRCLEKALALETLPSVETLVNLLDLEPTVLDELLAAKGWRLAPLDSIHSADLSTAAGVINAMGELVAANTDGIRDHNETLAVATMLRPHLPAITAIVREADAIRGNA
jgi:hypothetical protein